MSRKIKICILDDQRNSALAKLSGFFLYTRAPLGAADAREILERLNLTTAQTGIQLLRLAPDELFALKRSELEHTIFLVDLNWSAGAGQFKAYDQLSPYAREAYGLTLAEYILKNRLPDAETHIILFSNSKGDKVAEYYTEWILRGEKNVWHVVSGEGRLEDPLIEKYGWNAYRSICRSILRETPVETAAAILRGGRERVTGRRAATTLRDFVGDHGHVRVGGYRLEDLAWPFLSRQTRAETTGAAGSVEPGELREWRQSFSVRHLALDFAPDIENQTTLFLKALLRYESLHYFDAVLHFRSLTDTRFFNPAKHVRDRIEAGHLRAQDLVLWNAFDRIPRIHLGTSLDKPKGGPGGIPALLRDRTLFDVERAKGNPEALLLIRRDGEGAYRLDPKPEVWIESPLRKAALLLDRHRDDPARNPAPLLEAFALDTDHLGVLAQLAYAAAEAVSVAQPEETRAVIRQLQRWIERLEGAAAALAAYRDLAQDPLLDQLGRQKKNILEDILGAQDWIDRWTALRDRLVEGLAVWSGAPGPAQSERERLLAIAEARDFEEKTRLLRESFPELGHTLVENARRNLMAACRSVGPEAPKARTRVAVELHRLFPDSNETVFLANITAFLDQALASVREEETLGADLRVLAEQRAKQLIARSVAHEAFPGLDLPSVDAEVAAWV